MRIVYHLGAHCTDDERLLRCLLKNRGLLAAENIVVPGPKRYRIMLRDAAAQLRGKPASRETQAMLLDQIMDGNTAERLILGWDQFLGYAGNAVRDALYPSAGERMRAFAQIFPDNATEFHLAIRNPASFVPLVFAKQVVAPLEEFLGKVDLRRLCWSDTIAALRAANPDVPLTVWCDEDAPILWPELLQRVSGHSAAVRLSHVDDRVAEIMLPEGFAALAGYLAAHPPTGPEQRRDVVAAFLDRYARPDAMDVEIELEGFDAALVADLTAGYDADLERIAGIEGVTLLLP